MFEQELHSRHNDVAFINQMTEISCFLKRLEKHVVVLKGKLVDLF